MAFNYSPKVITSGLILYFDAANRKSYPGTGTIWNDIMGNNYFGTLINGPTFEASNLGAIVFDGSNDYIELNTTDIITGNNPFTFESFYTVSNLNSGGEIFGNYGAGYTANTIWISGEYGVYINSSVYFPGFPIYGTIHMAVTRTTNGDVVLYKNGVSVNTGTLSSSITVGPNFRIGCDTNINGGVGGERLNGKIYFQRLYNRVLSASEVLQNYNATKSRFNLP